MQCNVLGTGPSEGVPAPFCDCTYCYEYSRRRSSLLVSDGDINILFDASPDMRKQLHSNNINSLDYVFLTHFHFDHTNGLRALYDTTYTSERLGVEGEVPDKFEENLGREFQIYCSRHTNNHLSNELEYITDSPNILFEVINDSARVVLGDIEVQSFSAHHAEGYLGFKISHNDRTVVYHPDYGNIDTDVEFEEVDDLIYDGSALLGYEVHGTKQEFLETIRAINPDNLYLTNISEHITQQHTDELKSRIRTGKIIEDNTII